MSSAIERYLKEDDPLRKTLATGDGGHKSGNAVSTNGADKGNNPTFSHAPADGYDTIESTEKHMRGHQEQCQCSRQCDF